VHHTLGVRAQIAEVLQRGHLLTDRDIYLAPFEAAVKEMDGVLDKTEALVSRP
jgi:CHASE3 domain sensor protein